MPPSPWSDAPDPATRERNDLAEAFSRLLLSDGPIAAQAPVFFQEPDGTMIWANDAYYTLAATLVNCSDAQKLLHPSVADAANATRTWSTSARGIANGRAVTVRAEPSLSAPEADALSTELQEQRKNFTINQHAHRLPQAVPFCLRGGFTPAGLT